MLLDAIYQTLHPANAALLGVAAQQLTVAHGVKMIGVTQGGQNRIAAALRLGEAPKAGGHGTEVVVVDIPRQLGRCFTCF